MRLMTRGLIVYVSSYRSVLNSYLLDRPLYEIREMYVLVASLTDGNIS